MLQFQNNVDSIKTKSLTSLVWLQGQTSLVWQGLSPLVWLHGQTPLVWQDLPPLVWIHGTLILVLSIAMIAISVFSNVYSLTYFL